MCATICAQGGRWSEYIPDSAQDFLRGYNTEDASRDLRMPSKLTVTLLRNIPLIGSASSSREVPYWEFNVNHFRIAHREVFPHSTFDTSSIDRGDSDAIRKAFREYTETALRAELDPYEWSGQNVRDNFRSGNDFRIPTDPKAARKTRKAVAVVEVSKEGRSWRKPSPSVQG